MGLPERDDVPVLGFIGRLDWQKGPDLIRDALGALMNEDCQVIMLGSGLTELEEWMKWAEGQYPDRFRGWVGFSIPMAHRITAGVDIFLMPSRFEPCGLNQLYSMRYGTLPVAHATGGLRDTIKQHNPFADISKPEEVGEVGTGWLFDNMSTQDFIEAAEVVYSRVQRKEGRLESYASPSDDARLELEQESGGMGTNLRLGEG